MDWFCILENLRDLLRPQLSKWYFYRSTEYGNEVRPFGERLCLDFKQLQEFSVILKFLAVSPSRELAKVHRIHLKTRNKKLARFQHFQQMTTNFSDEVRSPSCFRNKCRRIHGYNKILKIIHKRNEKEKRMEREKQLMKSKFRNVTNNVTEINKHAAWKNVERWEDCVNWQLACPLYIHLQIRNEEKNQTKIYCPLQISLSM